MSDQFLLIIRGAPATGKSTIGRSFRSYEKKVTWVETDAFTYIFSPSLSQVREERFNTSIVVIKHLLEVGYSVATSGTYHKASWIQTLIEFAKEKSIPSFVVRIESSLEILEQRDKDRPGVKDGIDQAMDTTLIQWFDNEIKKSPVEGEIILNTDNKTVKDCIDFVQHTVMNTHG